MYILRWFHESSRWLAINNKTEQAVKMLKSVARFNGRHEEGEKINVKVWQCHFHRIVFLFIKGTGTESMSSLCIDAARIYEKRTVLLPGDPLCP